MKLAFTLVRIKKNTLYIYLGAPFGLNILQTYVQNIHLKVCYNTYILGTKQTNQDRYSRLHDTDFF